jgi:hypothetical protein
MRIFKKTSEALAKRLVKLMLIFFVFGIGLLIPLQIFSLEELHVQFLFRLIRPVIPVNSTTHCNMKGKEKKIHPEVDELNFS